METQIIGNIINEIQEPVWNAYSVYAQMFDLCGLVTSGFFPVCVVT